MTNTEAPRRMIRLVDLAGSFWPQWRARAGEDIDAAANGTLSAIRRFSRGCGHVAICCDRGPYFRREIAAQFVALEPEFKGYKGTRPDKDPIAIAQLERVQRELAAEGYPLFEAQGFEADDIIATLAEWAVAQGYAVEILSEDKDVRCLVRPGVTVLRRSDEVVDEKAVLDRFGVEPRRIPEYLAIVGDPGDGVLGVRGIGPEKVPALFAKFGDFNGAHTAAVNEQVDVEREAAEREAIKLGGGKPPALAKRTFTPAMRQNIIAGARHYEIGLALTTLRTDVPIDCARVLAERKPPPNVARDAEMAALLNEADAEAEAEEAALLEQMRAAVQAEERAAREAVDKARDEEDERAHEVAQAKDPMSTITEAEFTETPKAAPQDRPSDPQQSPFAPQVIAAPVAPPVATPPAEAPQNTNAAPKRDALATVALPERPFNLQLEPRTPKEADWLARCLYASKQFKDLVSVEAAYVKIAVGRSMGLTLYQSLSLHMFQGRVVKPAMMIVAQIRQHPQCEFFRKRSGDKDSAIWETKRKGDPRVADWEFTIGEAREAQLVKADSGWAKYPKNMLSWRAATFLAREEWAEVVGDFLTPEEVADIGGGPVIETTGVAA